MSDHLPTLTLLKQMMVVDNDLITFKSHRLNEEKLSKIKQVLYSLDWNGHLRDPG